MKQKKMLALTLSQLEQLYRHELPELVSIAVQSDDAEAFKANLTEYIAGHPEVDSEAGKQIRLLIEFDGQEVHELSIGEQLPIATLSMLHSFLTGQWEEETETDLFIDLFQQFKRLHQPAPTLPSAQKIKTLTERWPSGLDEDVQHIRAKNKERILHALVQKIEHRKNPASRFHFEEGLSYEEKFNLVSEWWNDFRFHLAMAVKSPTELNRLLGNSLSAETMNLLSKARKKGMPFFATPYYLSLLNCTGSGYDDEALRSYILYSPQLVETYGQIRAWEREDIVEPGKPNAAGWLLPDGHNIHRRYPEVAILIPDTMGRACGGLCASCQRMYDFQSKRLNFEFDTLRPKETWEKKLRRLMAYFEEDTQLRDILITGGDALMSQNKTLGNILVIAGFRLPVLVVVVVAVAEASAKGYVTSAIIQLPVELQRGGCRNAFAFGQRSIIRCIDTDTFQRVVFQPVEVEKIVRVGNQAIRVRVECSRFRTGSTVCLAVREVRTENDIRHRIRLPLQTEVGKDIRILVLVDSVRIGV